MLNGLTLFFAITTTAVIAYPLIKLLPSWRDRLAYRKAAFHREAIDTIVQEIERMPPDPERQAQLLAQQQQHTAALAAMVR